MGKISKNILFLLVVPALIFSCSKGDSGDVEAEAYNPPNATANITYSDLVGHWKLRVMQADSVVDLDKNGTGHTNLLEETDCFAPMFISFNDDMTFSSVNSRMDFKAGENDDEFFCMGNRTDTGTWDIQGDELSLNYNINGSVYAEKKILVLTENNFAFEVTKQESQAYVEDPGDTSVSHIQVMKLEYSRTSI